MTIERFKLNLSLDQIRGIATYHSGFLIDEYILGEDVVKWLDENFSDSWSYDFFNGTHISFRTESDALLFKLRWL